MFFRRETAKTPSFEQRMEALRQAGFAVAPRPDGSVRVTRGCYGIDLRKNQEQVDASGRSGVVIGDEIGMLVDGGFQKFFQTPSGKKRPALADDLKAIHDFDEDLKEALGQKSLYNESLGTVSTFYLYDRVKDRDQGVPKRIWE